MQRKDVQQRRLLATSLYYHMLHYNSTLTICKYYTTIYIIPLVKIF